MNKILDRLPFLVLGTIFSVTGLDGLTHVGILSATEPVIAEPPAKILLTEFWSVRKKREADQFYASLERKTPDLIYAYALVKSHQHDVRRALEAIDELHRLDDSKPESWRLKVWIQLRLSAMNGAVASIEKFVDVVKNDKSLDDFNRKEAYRFAGRIFAFLEGPVRGKVNGTSVATLKRKVTLGLDPELLKALEFEYDLVIRKYQQMVAVKDFHEKDFAVRDAEIRKMKLARLEKVEQDLEDSKAQLGNQSGAIRDEANRELNTLKELDAPLASQEIDLQSELNLASRDLVLLISDYNYWNNLAFIEPRPRLRSYYYLQAGRLDGLLFQQRLTVSSIRNELRTVQAQRSELQRQFAVTNVTASQQLADIDDKLKDLSREERITFNKKVKNSKPSKKIITHSVAIKSKVGTIVTFDQFPLEIEKQILLDRLSK